MSGGRLFHACGPACAKARSPNDVVVIKTIYYCVNKGIIILGAMNIKYLGVSLVVIMTRPCLNFRECG